MLGSNAPPPPRLRLPSGGKYAQSLAAIASPTVSDGRDDEHQRPATGPPRLGSLIPGGRSVLHLGPDEVVAGIGHGAIGAGVGGRGAPTAHPPPAPPPPL